MTESYNSQACELQLQLHRSITVHKPLKVLFVTNMYPSGSNPGAGSFVRQQAEHLRRAGHHIDVVRIDGQRSRFEYLTKAFEVFRLTEKTPYDIVHAHYGLSAFPALFRCNAPLVVTLHGSDALLGLVQPLISKTVCSLANAVIVVSKKICARIKGELIPCGVDLELFKPVDRVTARNRLGLSLDKTFILFPFDPRRKVKRVDLAQSAVDLMSDPQVQLLSVSGKTNEEMPLYYSAADAMVLCSESEGSPTSVKEALACNLPVVSVDVGDVREIIDGVAGCEICLGTPESLANGLRRILSRKWDRPFDGRQSMARYDQDSTVKAVIEVYDRVIREQHSRYDS